MTEKVKYSFLSLLFVCAVLTSCVRKVGPDTDLSGGNDILDEIQNGYSLNLTVTLDKMGGAAATKATVSIPELEEIEDYIDPEKFRVLFFDHNEKFLFESKSRWVKLLDETSDHSSWFVSIPVFSYGNDVGDYDWPWEKIREALTTEPFKIAILANRPNQEWCPDFGNAADISEHWFDNRGPFWTKYDYLEKTLFDLHHCQYDPVYTGKSWTSNAPKRNGAEGYYEFVMGYDAEGWKNGEGLTMGATSSWVDWTTTGFDGKRCPIPPSYDRPIPMYGVQKFNKITNWTQGTPFNLSDVTASGENAKYEHKSISLLRSVVKLELIIPKKLVDNRGLGYVAIYYPNIYARCEPMDIWTPTEDLWKPHGKWAEWDAEENCEWKAIMNYGPIARAGDGNPSTLADYQKRISWLYGAWLDKDPEGNPYWDFKAGRFPGKAAVEVTSASPDTPYPRIFNPCIQRNQQIVCDERTNFSDESNYHYIVYLGERNMNDPSSLDKMGNILSGQTTLMYWSVFMNGLVYSIPITDYDVEGNPALDIQPQTPGASDLNPNGSPQKLITADYANGKNDGSGLEIYGYSQWIHNMAVQQYDTEQQKVTKIRDVTKEQLPWPLMRNHVYVLTLGNTRAGEGLSVTCRDYHSKSIKFQ